MRYNSQPDDFKNIPFDRNANFAADASGEIIGEAKEITEYDLSDVKEGHKLYYVYEGKDGKPKAVEVNNEH